MVPLCLVLQTSHEKPLVHHAYSLVFWGESVEKFIISVSRDGGDLKGRPILPLWGLRCRYFNHLCRLVHERLDFFGPFGEHVPRCSATLAFEYHGVEIRTWAVHEECSRLLHVGIVSDGELAIRECLDGHVLNHQGPYSHEDVQECLIVGIGWVVKWSARVEELSTGGTLTPVALCS